MSADVGALQPPTVGRRTDKGPLRTVVLVSATGANLRTLVAMARRRPEELEIDLVVSHGLHVPALQVAREAGLPVWVGDFDAVCGTWSRARATGDVVGYRNRARRWHDRLDERLRQREQERGAVDLMVLAYHRWIHGDLLDRFVGRMLNQHPGDLSRLDDHGRRVLVGREPVLRALQFGHCATRTSTFLVDQKHDEGPVLCLGPRVPTSGYRASRTDAHQVEQLQKQRSDAPALEWAVRAFAAGRLALGRAQHRDGSHEVLVDGVPTPLGGHRIDEAA